MPFKKGMPRPANAGRKKGSANKITIDIAQRLADMGIDHVAGLAAIAEDKTAPVAVRARCYAELLEYTHPKLSRHEVVGPMIGGQSGSVRLEVEYVNKPKPE